MIDSKFRFTLKFFAIFIFLFSSLFLIGCQNKKKESTPIDKSNKLSAGQDNRTIANHLIQVRRSVGVTDALTQYYPDLDRERAYQIQIKMLDEYEIQGELLVGWKMGGANINNPETPYDPAFGFMLASNEVKSEQPDKSSKYVNGSPLIEAEIGFVINKDLLGPIVSREELIDAIEGVGGFSELISLRIEGVKGGEKPTFSHYIADGLSHGGFIRPQKTFPLKDIDIHIQKARVEINNEVISEGDSKNYAFIDAVLFLANSLPKYGRHLKAGDIVITGSILVSPPAKAGDAVEIAFSNFESLNVKFE